MKNKLICLLLLGAGGCATVSDVPEGREAPVSRAEQQAAQKAAVAQPVVKTLKRKIAVVRFTNESQYGRSLLRDKDRDALGKQSADILINRLVESGRFLVFERLDLSKVKSEQELIKDAKLIGVDALIIGSLTDFNRKTTGKRGFLSSTKLQTARAEVELRLVDARTGLVFFSASGRGESSTESGQVAGFGSRAGYDATLNDKAIGAAVADVLNPIINKLEARKWWTDILKVDAGKVFISGGQRQGINVGDTLTVMRRSERVESKQSGFQIELPPTPVGKIQIVSLFGDNESNEGAVGKIIGKPFKPSQQLFVTE